jgi:TusA-related sulfurtransferase
MELICSMRRARVGDVLAVIANDAESKVVIPCWVARAREELLGTEISGDATRFIVRKVH